VGNQLRWQEKVVGGCNLRRSPETRPLALTTKIREIEKLVRTSPNTSVFSDLPRDRKNLALSQERHGEIGEAGFFGGTEAPFLGAQVVNRWTPPLSHATIQALATRLISVNPA
jgi:hypothetical protein